MKISVVALVIAIIAFVGMAINAVGVDTLQGRIPVGQHADYMQIQYFNEEALNRVLLTEDQRQIGLHLTRFNDGSIALRCRNGVMIARFDIDASVSDIRDAADAEMLSYWSIVPSECQRAIGE